MNYIRFACSEEKSMEWRSEDDEIFTKLYFEYGAKWAEIVHHMPERYLLS